MENTSVEPVTITALTDDYPLSAEAMALVGQTIPVGGSVSATYEVDKSEAGTYNNTANVTVKDNEGNPASDSDNETVTVTDVLPTLAVDKSVTPASKPEPGGSFDYAVKVTNTSPEAVTLTHVEDDKYGVIYDGESITLGPGESKIFPFSMTHTEAGVYPERQLRPARTTRATPRRVRTARQATVTDVNPTVDITKSVTPSKLPWPGGTFHFTLTIKNTSVEPVTITALTDTNISPVPGSLVGTTLAVGETKTVTYDGEPRGCNRSRREGLHEHRQGHGPRQRGQHRLGYGDRKRRGWQARQDQGLQVQRRGQGRHSSTRATSL